MYDSYSEGKTLMDFFLQSMSHTLKEKLMEKLLRKNSDGKTLFTFFIFPNFYLYKKAEFYHFHVRFVMPRKNQKNEKSILFQ